MPEAIESEVPTTTSQKSKKHNEPAEAKFFEADSLKTR